MAGDRVSERGGGIGVGGGPRDGGADPALRAPDALPWAELFAFTPLALAVQDPAAERILHATPAFARLHGYAPDAVAGRAARDFYAPEALAAFRAQVARAGTERAASFRTVRLRADGSTFPARVDSRAMLGAAGDVRYWVVTVEDLTESEATAEARARLAAIVESSEDAIVGATLGGTITNWNAAAERLFGYPAAEVMGRPVVALAPPDLRHEPAAVLERVARGERVPPMETTRLRRDGTRVHVLLSVSAVRDAAGTPTGVAAIFRDITARKEAEAAEHFLADASARLAQSLDADVTVRELAQLAIEGFADGCLVTLRDEAAEARGAYPFVHVGVASRAPGRADLVLEMERRFPLPPDAPSGFPRAIRTGRPELVPAGAFDEAVLPSVAAGPEHLALLRALDMRSAVVAPLTAGGRTLGAVTLVRHGPEQRPAYTEQDLRVADELGRRAGVALDNARLFAAERRARRLVDDVLARTSDAFVLLDRAGRMVRVNATAARMLGRPAEALEGVAPEDVLPPGGAAELARRCRAAAATGEPQHFVARADVPGGGPAWLEVDAYPSAEGLAVFARDVTARVGAEEALLASERRTRALVESVTDPLIGYARDWRVVYLNEPARRMFRASGVAGEPVGRVLWELAPSLLGSETERAMRAAMDAGEPTTFEVGERAGTWIEVRTYPMGDGLVAYWSDVTERRRQREHAELLAEAGAALAETVGVEEGLRALVGFVARRLTDYAAVHLAEADGPVRLVEVAHRDPARAAVAREIEARYPLPADAPVGAPAAIRTGRPSLQRELAWERVRLAARDDAHLALLERVGMVSSLVVPLTARGRTLGALTLVSAESGRRYDERDLALVEEIARRAALAVDNARLYAQAEEARARAEEANQAKSDFLATMSHELRTPLNAIGGHVQLIELGLHGAVTEGQREALARVGRAQERLLGLINDVLNFARLESGRVEYHLRAVEASEVAAEVAALLAPQLAGRGIALDVTPAAPGGGLRVLADREKLGQVLLNLLSNAVKFTPAGGRIAVELGPADAATAALRVRDTGVGIPADKLQSIFEPFVQLERRLSTTHEGTGLGLAISRDLARGMGGDLTVESELGIGSAFTLTLPRAE